MVVASCFLYLAPLVPHAVIDGILRPSAEPSALVNWTLFALGGHDLVAENLWWPAIVVVAVTTIGGIGTYLRGRWAAMASEDIVRRLRDRVYDHLQRLPCEYFDSAETGDLVQRCTSDVETVRVFLATHVVEIGRALIMFFVPLPLMLAINPQMTAAAVVLIPVIIAFSWVFFLKVRSAFEEKDEAEGKMTTTIQENLTGIRVVRAFARQEHEEAAFADRNQTHRDLDYKLYKLMAVFWSVSDILTFAQMVLVVGAGVVLLSQGALGIGAFFFSLTAVGMFVWPLRQMGRIVADLGKATVALGRLREVLETPNEGSDGDTTPISNGEIVFDNVTFAFGAAPPALVDVSFTISARSTVAFVGASGSGKSTLIALLMRLYEPDSGELRLDGRPVNTLERQALRRQLAVVLQQPFLFSKSLIDNLRLGRADASLDDVQAATGVARVHDTIEQFEDGYETSVGERGVTLSGGQRQRIALARALLQRPSVLVLDDALSAVDTGTEKAILDQLAARRGRQTTILIAHRLSTTVLADRIFVLDEGRIVQEGSHASLVREDGPYAVMWRLQTHASGAIPLREASP
jgi:ATP-binding cassette subfamily B protein